MTRYGGYTFGRYLVNTAERSMFGGDAGCCYQIYHIVATRYFFVLDIEVGHCDYTFEFYLDVWQQSTVLSCSVVCVIP